MNRLSKSEGNDFSIIVAILVLDLSGFLSCRIWDKVVCGSSKILVFVAVGLLMVYRHPLLMEKSSQGVDKFFSKVCLFVCLFFWYTQSLKSVISNKLIAKDHWGFILLQTSSRSQPNVKIFFGGGLAPVILSLAGSLHAYRALLWLPGGGVRGRGNQPNPLPFYTILADKVSLSYTFCWKKIRRLHSYLMSFSCSG